MNHECIQTRRLFIIERDATAESAKSTKNLERIYELLAEIGREIGSLGHNTSRELSALRKEVAVLSKTVKKSQ